MQPNPPPFPQQQLQLFQSDFIKSMVHQFDPDLELTPESERFLKEFAFDFLNELIGQARSVASKRNKDKPEIEAHDIFFIMQTIYGQVIPTIDGSAILNNSYSNAPSVSAPTEEYIERIDAIRSFLAHRDE